MSKAFKRTVISDDYVLDSAQSAYDIYIASGHMPVDAFLHSIVSYLLFSPEFLFKSYRGSSSIDGVFNLSNDDLAHKISFLFWGEPASNHLLSLDWKSLLSSDQISLETELIDIVANEKSKYFITNFLNQWLGLDELPQEGLEVSNHDKYESELKAESEHFIRSIIWDNEPASTIVNANYTFLNQAMADYYQVAINGLGTSYQKVNLSDIPDLANRQGLFTQANYLTIGRKSDRPGSVARGVTLLTKALCHDLGVPSGESPDLSQVDRSMHTETSLFRMVTETPGTTCVGCHESINPVSFTFEVFDKNGRHPFSYANSDGSIPEFLIYDTVGIPNHPLANGPILKSDVFFLDQRSGSINLSNHHGHTISGSFNNHKELLTLLGNSQAFTECLTDQLYDYIIGTTSEKGMSPSHPDQAAKHHAHTCSKRQISQNATGVRDIIINLIKTKAFTTIRRN